MSELEGANIDVLVVTFERPDAAARSAADMALPWPILVDSTRELYGVYRMGRAGKWDVWGPSSWWAYARQFARCRWPRRSHDDVYQRGGDVLIDPSGVIRLHHVGVGPSDRPSVELILAAAKPGASLELTRRAP
ncbi:MAG: AhpC/TSA family protein [Myxococcales bacterium]|nr:AhpC/TSA family protein [Myxococcales bacterium]